MIPEGLDALKCYFGKDGDEGDCSTTYLDLQSKKSTVCSTSQCCVIKKYYNVSCIVYDCFSDYYYKFPEGIVKN